MINLNGIRRRVEKLQDRVEHPGRRAQTDEVGSTAVIECMDVSRLDLGEKRRLDEILDKLNQSERNSGGVINDLISLSDQELDDLERIIRKATGPANNDEYEGRQ
jgi:hypothetical protein